MSATRETEPKAGSRRVPSNGDDRENHDGPAPGATSCLPAPPRSRIRTEHHRTYRITVLGTIPSTLVSRISSLHASSIVQAKHTAVGRAVATLGNAHNTDSKQGELLHPKKGGKQQERNSRRTSRED
jgi:hypothetical protein